MRRGSVNIDLVAAKLIMIPKLVIFLNYNYRVNESGERYKYRFEVDIDGAKRHIKVLASTRNEGIRAAMEKIRAEIGDFELAIDTISMISVCRDAYVLIISGDKPFVKCTFKCVESSDDFTIVEPCFIPISLDDWCAERLPIGNRSRAEQVRYQLRNPRHGFEELGEFVVVCRPS